jgi:lipopolysaccharide export LptBFGC system permease protein LptF
MKIIYLYLAREILTYFLIAVLIFSGVFMMGKTLQLTELLVNKGGSLFDISKLLIYFLRSSLISMIPIALLLAVLITFVRLSSNNEIVAFKASGVSLYQLTPLILFLSIMAYLLTTFIVIYALVQKLTFGGNLSRIRGFRARDWEMSIGELKTKIKIKKILQEDYTQQLFEIYRKFSIPFAYIAFGLLGIPLRAQPRRSGKSGGFILGILVVLGYYVLLTSAETLAYNGPLPPLLASWTPNLILIAIGFYFLVKTARESPIQILQWLGEIVDSAAQRIKKFS